MKKILLSLLFVVNISFGQTYIQVSTNSNSIYTFTDPNTTSQPTTSYGNTTNDSGLNTILQNFGITSITYNEHPVDNTLRSLFFEYNGSNFTGLSNALLNYNSLVTKVSVCPQYETFGDVLISELIDANIGLVTGTDANGIILTNDAGLNTIYQNRNVTSAEMYLFSGVYMLQCDCNVNELAQDLQNYSNVINNTEYHNVVHLLNTQTFDKQSITIYPNPVADKVFIETENDIKELKLINAQGKIIGNYSSVEQLNTQINLLSKGVYFLEISDSNTVIFKTKILKQ